MRVDTNKEYSFESDQFLYKYMDLHRLIYFLTTGRLFFSPLSYFDDPLEGISEKLLYHKKFEDHPHNVEQRQAALQEKQNFYSNFLEKVQRTLFASCWFLGIRESLAMWDSYSNWDSVAIRFDPGHLCDIMTKSFAEISNVDFEAMIHGKVEYFKLSPFDPNDQSVGGCGHKYSGFLKDISYKHEEEFRFLLMRTQETNNYDFYEFTPGPLQSLDFKIISHPNMEEWKYNNIYNILQMHGLQARLLKSEIPTRRHFFPWEI